MQLIQKPSPRKAMSCSIYGFQGLLLQPGSQNVKIAWSNKHRRCYGLGLEGELRMSFTSRMLGLCLNTIFYCKLAGKYSPSLGSQFSSLTWQWGISVNDHILRGVWLFLRSDYSLTEFWLISEDTLSLWDSLCTTESRGKSLSSLFIVVLTQLPFYSPLNTHKEHGVKCKQWSNNWGNNKPVSEKKIFFFLEYYILLYYLILYLFSIHVFLSVHFLATLFHALNSAPHQTTLIS